MQRTLLTGVLIILANNAFGQFSLAPVDTLRAPTLKHSILKPIQTTSVQAPLLQAYNPYKLSFFCKREALQWNDDSMPAYFRLGSKDEVDRLEKKNNFQSWEK